jgi:hypothetical protein
MLIFSSKLLACLLLWCITSSLAFSQIVEEGNMIIEVVGLKHRTIEQLKEHIKRIDPSLRLAVCAAKLEMSGFPEVSLGIGPRQGDKPYAVLSLVEPEDSMYISRRQCFSGYGALPLVWEKINKQIIFSDDSWSMSVFMNRFDSTFIPPQTDTAAFKKLCREIRELPINVSAMASLIKSCMDVHKRSLAIIALSSYPQNDTAWYAMIAALRDINDRNGILASIALELMLRQRTTRINWSSAYPDMKFLANGTHLEMYYVLLKVLSQTYTSVQDFDEVFSNKHSRELLVAHYRAKRYLPVQEPLVKLMERLHKGFGALPQSEQEKILMGKYAQ